MLARRISLLCLGLILAVGSVACGGSRNDSLTDPVLQEPTAATAGDFAARGNDRYDGEVIGASAGTGIFSLDDGTTVQTTVSTRWKSGGARIVSVAGLVDALAAGMTVQARGKGTVDSGMLIADDVDARVSRGSLADEERFDAAVASSDGVRVTLESGAELQFNAATRWRTGPDRLGSAAAIAEAVATGIAVRARGTGLPQADSSLLVSEIDARVRESATRNFRGTLTDVVATESRFQLDSATTVRVLEATSWKRGPRRITSLADLESAFAAGADVSIRGKGVEQLDGSIVASELDVQFRARALARFRGRAASVDLTLRTITFEDGTVLAIFDGTAWKRGGRWLGSLEAIGDALAAGDSVNVMGKGTGVTPGAILAALVRAKVRPASSEE